MDYKESWALKNWCFWTVVLEKTLESPLDSKEIKPVNPKKNQSWIFIGRIDAEDETPYLTFGREIYMEIQIWKSFGHLMWRTDSLEKTWCWEGFKAGGEGDNRGWDSWMASPIWWSWVWVSSESWWWTGKPGLLQSMWVAKSQTRLSDWSTNTSLYLFYLNKC